MFCYMYLTSKYLYKLEGDWTFQQDRINSNLRGPHTFGSLNDQKLCSNAKFGLAVSVALVQSMLRVAVPNRYMVQNVEKTANCSHRNLVNVCPLKQERCFCALTQIPPTSLPLTTMRLALPLSPYFLDNVYFLSPCWVPRNVPREHASMVYQNVSHDSSTLRTPHAVPCDYRVLIWLRGSCNECTTQFQWYQVCSNFLLWLHLNLVQYWIVMLNNGTHCLRTVACTIHCLHVLTQ